MDPALLGVGGLLGPDRQIEVELIESGGANLAHAGAGQHAEADNPGRAMFVIVVQNIGQPLNFIEGQEPFAGSFGPLAEGGGRIVGPHLPRDGEAEHLTQHFARPVGTDRRRLGRLQRGSALGLGGGLGWPWPPQCDLGQQAVHIRPQPCGCANPAGRARSACCSDPWHWCTQASANAHR